MIPMEYQPYIWAITVISLLIFLIFALALRGDLSYGAARLISFGRRKPRRSPGYKPLPIWLMFLGLGFTAVLGSGMLLATFQQADGAEQAFIPPPTPVMTPTPEPPTPPLEPLQIDLRLPAGLDPCNIDTLTIIPENVDPYSVSLVHPIEPWFEKQQFLQTAFTHLRVNNISFDDVIRLANQVLVKIQDRQPLPGPLNAAFTNCENTTPYQIPVLELDSMTTDASIWVSEDRFTDLTPGESQSLELKLVGIEPGYYEVLVGVQYVYRGEVRQVWADRPIVVSVPEKIQRWSAGIITYWGDCFISDGSYECEEVVLEEPILEPDLAGISGDPDDPDRPVCTLAPPNRLEIGKEAEVSRRLGLRLRIREEPGLDSNIITSMPRGTRMTVLEGPVCQDGYYWWNVEMERGALTGWMAEGEPRLYYLEPLP
jgi:hypothetical protein